MKVTLMLLSTAATAFAQQAVWQQCGGLQYKGVTTCVAGTFCKFYGDYYSQCIPGTATTTVSPPTTTTTSTVMSSKPTSTSTSSKPTSTSTMATSSSTTSTKSISMTTITTLTSVTTTTPSGPSTTATLSSGYLWIRAVESPNFHSYLQTAPTGVPGVAKLASYTTAGQFQIVSGQLVETTPSGLLYANVENPANITGVLKLGMSFSTSKNTFGSFAFGGDAVQWSASGVSRPNLSAWLVCENQNLYINLGNYAYLTPAGCADETIHFYNGATANGGN